MAKIKYNPLLTSDDELEKTFIGRGALLQSILSDLNKNLQSSSNQHAILIGPRGIGKTTFLHKIYLSIKQDPDLRDRLLPLRFSEEMYSISSFRDFFETICALLDQAEDGKPFQDILTELQKNNDDNYCGPKYVETLKQYLQYRGVALVLFVENLHLILDKKNISEIDVKRLRDVFMNERFMIVIATTPTIFGGIMDYDSPLYNLFKLINLQELNDDEVMELLCKRAEYEQNDEIRNRLPIEAARIKALNHLTSGNPRLILMLYYILTGRQITDVKDNLISLLDELTPYYKHRIEDLSPQQRRIIDTMAQMDQAVSPTEIAEAARMQVNTVSANLGRLKDAGMVTTAKQERRKATYYIISERLFRIWYQMRSSTEARTKIAFFLDFIRIWYSPDEAKTDGPSQQSERVKSVREASAQYLNKVERLDYFSADSNNEQISSLVQSWIALLFKDANKNLDEAEMRYRQSLKTAMENNDSVTTVVSSSYIVEILLAKREFDEARNILGIALKIEHSDAIFWCTVGTNYRALSMFEEAKQCFDRAVQINPHFAEAWVGQGRTLKDLGRNKEALESFDSAIQGNPGLVEAWNERGYAFMNLKQFDDALKSMQQGATHCNTDDQKNPLIESFVDISLHGASYEATRENITLAKNYFSTAVESIKEIIDSTSVETARQHFFRFFRTLAEAKYSRLSKNFLGLLDSPGLKELKQSLFPFEIVNRYWESNRDPEILDRLNPEVREIVEEIIAFGENTDEKPHE